MRLILCSSSAPRKLLLTRLQLPFETAIPNVDETPLPDESAEELVVRLARAKAQIHQDMFPNSLLIGCDQVASVEGIIYGKPGNKEQAVAQLQRSSGKEVQFLVGMALFNTETKNIQIALEYTTVVFRQLTDQMIENYLQREKPYHCAGSVKGESLGVALFERITSDDPTALIGLPLIKLTNMLENENVSVL